jgi:hypothetical protein
MKPRASIPSTRSTVTPAKWSAMASITNRNASGSPINGVMSRNVTPGVG